MALVNRIARLFRADLHAVLDQLEEPEQVLRQAVRDMEDELADAQRRIAVLAHEESTLEDRHTELEASLADVEAQLELCFGSGRDELAKKMLRRKLETERLLTRIALSRQSVGRRLAENRQRLEEDAAVLQGLRQKAELFARPATTPAEEFPDPNLAWVARQVSVSDEEVEIAYLREKDLRRAS